MKASSFVAVEAMSGEIRWSRVEEWVARMKANNLDKVKNGGENMG